MSELISQTEFARRVGKSKQYINKLVRTGVIILHNRKVDFEEANLAIETKKRASNIAGDKFNQEQKGKGGKQASLERSSGAAEIDPDVKNTSKAMQKAKLLAEINNAKIKEIEYKKAVGELLPISVVNSELSKVAEVVRTKLLSLEDKLPPLLINESSQNGIKDVIRKEVNSILEEFQELSKTAVSNYEI